MKTLLSICCLLFGTLLNGSNGAPRFRRVRTNDRCVFFRDSFSSGIDENMWSYSITGYGGGNEEFQSYIKDENVIWGKRGLHIKPTPLAELTNPMTGNLYGDTFYENGMLDYKAAYGDCTETYNHGCIRDNGNIPPIASGKVQSKMSFMYGQVKIRAKLPRGDWMWPALWLLPKNCDVYGWPYCGEMDMAESRGNDGLYDPSGNNMGNHIFTSAMHFCKNYTQDFYEHKPSPGRKTWADEYHDYILDWQPRSVTYMVDDDVVMRFDMDAQGDLHDYCKDSTPWTTNNGVLKPFDQPFYILLNVAVGGRSNFFSPSFTPNKPWSNYGTYSTAIHDFYNAKTDWYPTWARDGELVVKSVQVSAKKGQSYQLNGVDYTC